MLKIGDNVKIIEKKINYNEMSYEVAGFLASVINDTFQVENIVNDKIYEDTPYQLEGMKDFLFSRDELIKL